MMSTLRPAPSATAHRTELGLTLIELVVVLTILVALGGLVVPLIGSMVPDAREEATRATLVRLRDTIAGPCGYCVTMRHAEDTGGSAVGAASGLPWPGPASVSAGTRSDHPQLAFLFNAPGGLPTYDRLSKVGWRGPYCDVSCTCAYAVAAADGFTSAYGLDGDPTPVDGWGRPIVLQLPDVVAGIHASELEAVRLVSAGPDGVIDTPATTLAPTLAQTGDDLVLYLAKEDPNG